MLSCFLRHRVSFASDILPSASLYVSTCLFGALTEETHQEYDFERIVASTAGVYTHGDFRLREPSPLIFKMLVGKLPKPSIFTKGRIAYGKQDTAKSDTLLRLR